VDAKIALWCCYLSERRYAEDTHCTLQRSSITRNSDVTDSHLLITPLVSSRIYYRLIRR